MQKLVNKEQQKAFNVRKHYGRIAERKDAHALTSWRVDVSIKIKD